MALPLDVPGSAALQRRRGRPRPKSRTDVLLGRVGPLALCVALLVQASAPDLLLRAAIPVAVIGVLIGVPHGAVDHLVPFWLAGRRPTPREIALVLARYLLVAALAAVAFLVLPDLTFAAFLLASVVHFGRAEVQFGAERSGAGAVPGDEQWLRTVAHGAAVVVVPFAVWPDQVASAIRPLAPALCAPGRHTAWVLLGTLAAALVLASVVGDLRAGRLREAGESALLLAAVVALPPLVSFAVYFGAWHALRHTGRLLALPARDGRTLATAAALGRYARHAAGPTLVVAAVSAVLVGHASGSVLDIAVSVVLALTFPHMRTVAEWDRRATESLSPNERSYS